MPEVSIPLMHYEARPLIDAALAHGDDNRLRHVTPTTSRQRGYKFSSNAVSNAKYNAVTFLPVILYEQFKFFFNLYFLLVALSQIWRPLRIGYLSSYIVPLAFVLSVTIGKELWDDWLRRRRDAEANAEEYVLSFTGAKVRAKDLRVGDILTLETNKRVPADIVILKSSEANGETFIRTDQLDGETDWKLRQACPATQAQPFDSDWDFDISAAPPEKSIHIFNGSIETASGQTLPLSVDNTMWANTVVAAGTVEGVVVYTGRDTRMAMNTSSSRNKTGLLELEVNNVSKILCASVFLLSFVLVALKGFGAKWYVKVMRFLILFSTIIPVSLRVNLDMAKTVYAYQIEHDKQIPETIVRTSTIPEDLGRIDYLLTDKTGTITQNDMDLKKIHIGTMSFYGDSMEDVAEYVAGAESGVAPKRHRETQRRIWELVLCLGICHSVTPIDGGYQAVSPDEIAIVEWTASVGLELVQRDRRSLSLKQKATGRLDSYDILYIFPFNSDSKRMGIVARKGSEVFFFCKGADTVMTKLVKSNDWLEEEVANMAREGLRTLVIARKSLTQAGLDIFEKEYHAASLIVSANRDTEMSNVVAKHLEHSLDLLGITGVEDKLQRDVRPSLELLRNAGVRIWMLTGDKVETAKCVAVSSRLVSRGQRIHEVTRLSSLQAAHQHLDFLRSVPDSCLLLDGESLHFYHDNLPVEFGNVALALPVVIACRCTPQQKADLAEMVKRLTGKRVCSIGDGGNDVSMIQAADVGVGIVGKEGRQASLAADFSVTQFCHVTKLLLWHGRNSYKRSAKLAQVIIHRGLVISVCQAVYSISSAFEPLALYQGWLMVGYATVYTMAPVFSLVTDHDVDEHLARMYPELYKELKDGRSLSYGSFLVWTVVALYQGILIQGLSQILTSLKPDLFGNMVMVSFCALVLTVLAMVAIEIMTWNKIMFFCEVLTIGAYIGSVPLLGEYFTLSAAKSVWFYGKVAVIIAAAVIPPYIAKLINRRLKPPSYAKVQV